MIADQFFIFKQDFLRCTRRMRKSPFLSLTSPDVHGFFRKSFTGKLNRQRVTGTYGSFHLWINVWVAGKTVWSLVNTCHTWTPRDESLIISAIQIGFLYLYVLKWSLNNPPHFKRVTTLHVPCDFFVNHCLFQTIANFLTLLLSQGSVATRLRFGGTFDKFISNLVLSLPTKGYWKLVIIWQNHGQECKVSPYNTVIPEVDEKGKFWPNSLWKSVNWL